MKFDWHGQHFDKVLHGIGNYAIVFIRQGYDPGGWYDHFQEKHPEPFAKYQGIYVDLNSLWGKTDSESMEKFKSLCKAFESAYKWAINKYMEFLKQEQSDPGIACHFDLRNRIYPDGHQTTVFNSQPKSRSAPRGSGRRPDLREESCEPGPDEVILT